NAGRSPHGPETIQVRARQRHDQDDETAKAVGRRMRRPYVDCHRQMLRKAVISTPLTKSIPNAPTRGATREAFGAGPYRSTSAPMLATAFAVVPSMNPQKPLDITTAS